ncbi:Hypothetical protein PFREUD_21180 [Propionibacterium freudenreichii subsp. shermanii CIRM-BIA1]|uniref:Uncharacterized protein n=1 Tax=Propionibacterium freudenreichii subsp. shermanii (strain ATCC 9614 / DSM 4902 / CIP 103027 / NCIMB 8099 / CIRM-BIA1) TaxID=754252 RepID=D7GGF5_PROFC|nr:Hypothetical protein PFREUD_21180 [Propionibacterium freudenreichii subsp. shermanii CIRM-BIA1]
MDQDCGDDPRHCIDSQV